MKRSNTRKLFSLFLEIAMLLTLLSASMVTTQASTGNHSNAAEPTKSDFYVFANGTPVIIRENAGKTQMFKISDPNTPLFYGADLKGLSIFGGFNEGDYVGDTYVVIEGGRIICCCGGNRFGSVTGSTNVIVNGGTFTYLYGGGMSSVTYGTTNITFNGGVCEGDVFGGNYLSDSVQGDAVINLKGGDFTGRTIYGGGDQNRAGSISGDATVNVYPAANVTNVTFSGDGVGGAFTVNYFTGLLLHANGGTGSVTAPPFRLGGGDFTVPANTFTAPAASGGFLAWNTAPDGSGISYQPGDTITVANAANVTLYAQWGAASGSAETYGYTFYHTPGQPPITSFIEKNGVFSLGEISNAVADSRPDHRLLGWSLTSGAMQVDFPTNGVVDFQRDTTFFAVWAYTSAPTITGPTALKLLAGYGATSTGAYTVAGAPAPTVTITSGDAKITWNNTTKKLDIAAGLAAGEYTVVLKAANGTSPDATTTFQLTVAKTIPTITGPTALKLLAGYGATSTEAYTVAGAPAPTVTIDNHHGGKITWDATSKKLDIAAGLAAGEYTVVLKAANGTSPDATTTFKLTVAKTIFSTRREATFLNWLLFFLGFGFIWMWL